MPYLRVASLNPQLGADLGAAEDEETGLLSQVNVNVSSGWNNRLYPTCHGSEISF